MRNHLKFLIILTVGSVVLFPLVTYAETEIGGGAGFNTYSLKTFNQDIIVQFNDMVSTWNDIIEGLEGVTSSLNTPQPIRSGFSEYFEARFWLLDFFGIGFEIEHLSGASVSSGTITVQTGGTTIADADIDLGAKINATGFCGQTLFNLPMGPANLLAKAVFGYYPTTLKFFARGSILPSEEEFFGIASPDKITINEEAVYHGSGMGFKGLLVLQVPINSFSLGVDLGFRLLRANMGDITADGENDFLNFSGLVVGLKAGMKL